MNDPPGASPRSREKQLGRLEVLEPTEEDVEEGPLMRTLLVAADLRALECGSEPPEMLLRGETCAERLAGDSAGLR